MNLTQIINENLGYAGRMICGSKSLYRKTHPNDIIYFNACIFDRKYNQIWWGDINLTLDKYKLDKIYDITKQIFYVTPEHPFRSDFHKVTQEIMKKDERVIKFGGKKKK